jgi:hypothetical protein
MQPLAYSHEQYRKDGKQWLRVGDDVSYKCDWSLPECNRLSFTYDFQHPNDKVLIAYNYPYTSADINLYIESLLITHPKLIRKEEICRTPLNNVVELLTITNDSNKQHVTKNK